MAIEQVGDIYPADILECDVYGGDFCEVHRLLKSALLMKKK